MICPVCKAAACRRSRRRSAADFLKSLLGSVPWRCSQCGVRFHARQAPFRDLLNAHCANCGNLELMRISGDYVAGAGAPLCRLLGIPAFRCVPCRRKFFSLLPLRKEYREKEFKAAS
jgi:hypothetical protein